MKPPNKTIAAITDFLFIGEKKENLLPSDLVLVLGNDQIEGTVAEIYDLYSKDIILSNASIILSGANGILNQGKELECNRLYDCAVEKYGIPKKLFIKEEKAKNACQNFEFSKDIVQSIGGFEYYKNILCIGKAFLLRRASMYAAKFNYPLEKMQYFGTVDADGKNIGPDTWWESDAAIKRVMAEIERIGKYYANGDLSIF